MSLKNFFFKCSYINTAGRRCTDIDKYIYTSTHMHARTQAHTHTYTHTPRTRAHTHKCADTNTIQTVGEKDNDTQLKCSEKRNERPKKMARKGYIALLLSLF